MYTTRAYKAADASTAMDDDCAAVPYKAFKEAVQFLPRAHEIRVALLMLSLTGCRVRELALMRVDGLLDCGIYWRLGKNQNGHRFEPLPAWFRSELADYRRAGRVPSERIFATSAQALRRYFNVNVRPYLGAAWQVRKRASAQGYIEAEQYVLQIKGLRKSFATTVFHREYRKWKDANAALLFACRRMKHSAAHITAMHYLKELDALDIHAWDSYLSDAEPLLGQQRILQYT